MTALRHVYLIDGSGFIFRAYHALPPLTSSDGTPVGAVLGFSNMLLKLSRGNRLYSLNQLYQRNGSSMMTQMNSSH